MKCIIYILLLMLLCVPVMAYENNITANITESYVIVEDPTESNTTPILQYATTTVNTSLVGRRIAQDACVVPGEVIDIAGLGWYTGTIGYYGRYYDNYAANSPENIVAVYHPKSYELKHFYLDPDFFEGHLGWWYGYYTSGVGSGNDRLFRVSMSCVPTPEQNITARVEQYNETTALIAFAKNITILPVKTEGGIDYIFSKQSVTTIDSPNNTVTRWIFGRVTPDTFYDTAVNSVDTFALKDLEPGNYDAVYINPGANGIVEESYDRKTKSITSPFKNKQDVSLYGIQPLVAKPLLDYAVTNSKDDTTVIKRIDVQDPSILVVKLSQNLIPIGPYNVTAFTLSGYTNANQGTTVNIQLDNDKSVSGRLAAAPWVADVVNNGGQVAYRAWTKSFLLDTGALRPGQHSFTVTNKEGASATVPFYVYQEPVPNYVPNASLSYIGNSPFIPTPTPQVIVKTEVQLRTVTQVVTVPVTPSQESVDEASQKALMNTVALTITGIVGVLMFIYLLTLAIRVIKNRRGQQ
jgi:hypothetical protein